MQEKVGKLIKRIAMILFCAEIAALVVAVVWVIKTVWALASGLSQLGSEYAVASAPDLSVFFWGILGLVAVVALLYIKNLLIYGFGEMIEHQAYTRQYAEYIASQVRHERDVADGVEFLCNQSIKSENSLAAIYSSLSDMKKAHGRARESSSMIEWECPQCGTKNPLKAKFCMNCGKST